MNPVSGISKLLYWPICRAYAKHIMGDKPADPLFSRLSSLQFLMGNHYWPNLKQPNRFSEKLWSRMLYDRNPQLTLLNDKLRARDYAAAKVGDEYLIPLLWNGDKPEEIPFDELPQKFVIKTNHGCGYNIIVKDKTQLDQTTVRRQVKKWLGENFCQDKYLGISWGYKNIKPAIIVESFLEENGEPATDYKYWCFFGRAECISVHFDRFVNHSTRTLNRDFEPYEFSVSLNNSSQEFNRPENYEGMLQVAELLADGFDFIRVDLYNLNGKIMFGEFTVYPGGVSVTTPGELDYVFGKKWSSNQTNVLLRRRLKP